jgi:hypothetical protein
MPPVFATGFLVGLLKWACIDHDGIDLISQGLHERVVVERRASWTGRFASRACSASCKKAHIDVAAGKKEPRSYPKVRRVSPRADVFSAQQFCRRRFFYVSARSDSGNTCLFFNLDRLSARRRFSVPLGGATYSHSYPQFLWISLLQLRAVADHKSSCVLPRRLDRNNYAPSWLMTSQLRDRGDRL